MSLACFSKFQEAGLSYPQLKEDVKKNIINIMIINSNDYSVKISSYLCFLTLTNLGWIITANVIIRERGPLTPEDFRYVLSSSKNISHPTQ